MRTHVIARKTHKWLGLCIGLQVVVWSLSGADQLAGKPGPVEGVGEEEPQRRDNAVHGRRRNAGFLLFDLEAADILGGRGVGRAPQPGREPPDIAQIVALRLRAEPAHGHILDQPLAQRADGRNRYKIVHLSTPRLKEPEWSALFDLLATFLLWRHPRRQHPSREAGSCNGPKAAGPLLV